MAALKALDPAPEVRCEQIQLIATEAARGVRGLVATVQVLGPLGTALQFVRLAVPKEREGFAAKVAETNKVDVEAVKTALLSLTAAVEVALREQSRKRTWEGSEAKENVYFIENGRIFLRKMLREGAVPVQLTNFAAKITTDIIEDDAEQKRHIFELEAVLDGKTYKLTIPSFTFASMNWVPEHLGAKGIVYPGFSLKDHARAAVQVLSGEVTVRTVYTHTGWRRIGETWVYLHAQGGIGKDGVDEGVEVRLDGALGLYSLPTPPEGDELKAVIVQALVFLRTGPDSIAFSIFAAVFRAALGACDFGMHLSGPTGAGKTELAALAQQFFGAEMTARHLPASWSSTWNALEAIAFHAKDALLVVDDFAPSGSVYDVQRFHREADRLLRAQGNNSGRARLRADATLQRTKRPRGLIVSTGEDVPRGQSLRARMLILELGPSDLRWDVLSECQRDAASGIYSKALSSFLRWAAGSYETITKAMPAEIAKLREKACTSTSHKRTPEIVANLYYGMTLFIEFAVEAGAITADEATRLRDRAWSALGQAAAAQAKFQEASEPTRRYLELLTAAISSGKAHVANVDGSELDYPAAWGWRLQTIGTGDYQREEWKPQGTRIGWVQGDDLYLEPDASYAAAQDLAREQGDSLTVTPRTLHKRLDEKRLLRGVDQKREVLTVRVSAEGRRQDVLHLDARIFVPAGISPPKKPDQPDQTGGEPPHRPETWSGRPENPTSVSHNKKITSGELVGLVGLNDGVPRPEGEKVDTGSSPPGNLTKDPESGWEEGTL